MSVKLIIERNVRPRHKWHWAVLMSNGHVFTTSKTSFNSARLAGIEAAFDGVEALGEAEEAEKKTNARVNTRGATRVGGEA